MADTCRLAFAVSPAGGHQFAVAALEINGVCEYDRHLRALERSNISDAAKVVQMLETLATNGTDGFKKDKTQCRCDLGDGLCELKPKQQRVLFFQAGRTWLITSAFQKPQERVQSALIIEGQRRKALYLRLVQAKQIQMP